MDESSLLDESNLLVFQLWYQLGGPSKPPGLSEVAEMDARMALDFTYLLRMLARQRQFDSSGLEGMKL